MLEGAALKAGLTPEALIQYQASATHQEILKGLGTGSAEGIMARGPLCRIHRSNTWPHRPREAPHQENPCQRRAVHTWRTLDQFQTVNLGATPDFRSTGKSRHSLPFARA